MKGGTKEMLKNKYIFFVMVLLLLGFSISYISAISTSTGSNPLVNVEKFSPHVWMCDSRIVYDDATEPGRISSDGETLVERINNYAFEGEQIQWVVLVMDKNKIDQNLDVFTVKGSDRVSSNRIKIIKVNKSVSYCDTTGVMFVPWSTNLEVPKFNTSLGKLVKVSVNGSALIEINASFENTNPITGSNYTITYNGGNISISFPENNFPILNNGFIVNGFVGPYDNITDFVGISGRSFNFINSSIISFNGINLSMYRANFPGEDLIIPASSSGNAEIIGLANFDGGVKTMSGADICIKYTYETQEAVSGVNYDIESNCQRIGCNQTLMPVCNARIDEERITNCSSDVMDMFRCTFTVETPESMYGEYWINVVAMDNEGNMGVMDENEYWYLNPVIALSIDGEMSFNEIRPGTDAYSSTMLVGNDADDSSGVLLDMFISGTDFYDSSSSGARCSITNQLLLNNFRYYATSGAYSTQDDFENDCNGGIVRDRDAEGYVNIDYGIGFNNPRPFYNAMEIIQAGGADTVAAPNVCGYDTLDYYPGNVLAPGAEMALTFKLSLPEPCVGNFDSGSIYFWGEAI